MKAEGRAKTNNKFIVNAQYRGVTKVGMTTTAKHLIELDELKAIRSFVIGLNSKKELILQKRQRKKWKRQISFKLHAHYRDVRIDKRQSKEKIELKAPVFARTPKFKVTDLPEHERNFLVRGKEKDNISFPNGVVKRGFA